MERKPRQRKWTRSPTFLSQLNPALMMQQALCRRCRALKITNNYAGFKPSEVFLRTTADGKALYQEFFSRALPIASNAMNCSIMSGTLQKSSYALAFTITVLYFGITYTN